MSRIDLNNYEAWLLDYSEGNLSAEDTAELMLFIEVNPQLEIDLSEAGFPAIAGDENIKLNDKSFLYKDISDVRIRFEELCLAYYDKAISQEEKSELDHILKQFPAFEKEFDAFGYSYLQPEYALEFENKESLKKAFVAHGSFEDLAVKSIEGTLSETERKVLSELVNRDEQLRFQMKAFQKTKLEPEIIVFPSKDSLYHSRNRGGILYGIFAIAASLAILFTIITFLNKDKSGEQGIAGIKTEISIPVRDAIGVQEKINSEQESSQKKNQIVAPEKRVLIQEDFRESIAQQTVPAPKLSPETLKSIPAIGLEKFELPSDYIALQPQELQDYLAASAMPLAQTESDGYLSPGQFIRKKVTKLFKKNNIDIETPLEDLQKNGFSNLGIKGLEKVTRGKVSIDREENSSKITALHFFGLTYNRSSN